MRSRDPVPGGRAQARSEGNTALSIVALQYKMAGTGGPSRSPHIRRVYLATAVRLQSIVIRWSRGTGPRRDFGHERFPGRSTEDAASRRDEPITGTGLAAFAILEA